MTEVLWHGRGGQGAFTAARLLGAGASLDDAAYALAFPSFGPERRGAPIRAFTKISTQPIGDRSAIERADYAIYLDETLFGEGWEAELSDGGCVLVNAPEVPAIAAGDSRVVAIDANRISSEILGRPIPNTVFLGVLAALGVLPIENAKRAIRLYMPAKLHTSNEDVVEVAYRAVHDKTTTMSAAVSDAGVLNVGVPNASKDAGVASPAVPDAFIATSEGLLARANCVIPTLQDDALSPENFARSTCFSAGHLIDKNAGWRNMRPVVDRAKCVGCLQCYLYCPDGTVFKAPSSDGKIHVAIDYDFCKGCGMCVRACKFGAIHMEPEVLPR